MATKGGEFLAGKKIIVVGAGFAGLAFVLALDQLWPSSTLARPEVLVYDDNSRDKAIEKNSHTLCINGTSRDDGLVVLRQLGLLDEVRKYSTLNGGDIRVWSENWKWLSSINPTVYDDLPAATMRITSQKLKSILIERAERTNTIFGWGSTCTSAERLSNSRVRVSISSDSTSAENTTVDCDLLVAADGANSRIRACFRPQDMGTQYSGATQIGGISYLSHGLPDPVARDFSIQISSGGGVCCIYHPIDSKMVDWALSKIEPEREVKIKFTAEEFSALKHEAFHTASMFREPFKTIVEATIPSTAFIRPAKEKPAFQHGSHLHGVIFLGEANHILNSFELLGANLALKDGYDLADQLRQSFSLGSAAASYDRVSIPRFEHMLNFSHERINFGHCTGRRWMFYKHGMAAQRAFKRVH